MEENQKELIVAVHSEDIDGIASAALILRKFSNAQIIFMKPNEIRRTSMSFDIVIDLPKPRNCRINIDHHKSNFEYLIKNRRIGEDDLVDPNAPSAACLVAKYYNLTDKISKEIVDMANKADKGEHDRKLMLLDLIIKCNVMNQTKLYWLSDKLSKLGKKIFKDNEFKREIEKLRPIRKKINETEVVVEKLLRSNIKAVVFDCMRIPYAVARVPPTIFTKRGGYVALSYYMEPDSGKIKISIRVGDYDFRADIFAERFGGGGHEKAAGLTVRGEAELAIIIKKFIDSMRLKPVAFVSF
ncbi:MAG: hypothetical protein Q6363_005385 [Candidatus Njordarchaeota archaeon]